jgi:hypothetical protein
VIILHDAPSSDLSHIQAVAGIDEGFSLFDYVEIRQQDNEAWVGQIVQPNQNVSIVGSRLEPTILHGLRLMQQHENVQSVQSVQVFDILIIGQLDGRSVLTPRLRPLPGAIVTRLAAGETTAFLEIPALVQHNDGSCNVIGDLLNADGVPLCVDARKYHYHIMVAGGTGSGKSNVAANLVDQAARFGKCVIVHDAKPDYGSIQEANTDARVTGIWQRFEPHGLRPHGAAGVRRIGFFGSCDPAAVDEVVGFRSSAFNPDMLAGLFFGGQVEQNQYEGFASAAFALRQRVQAFTLDDILTEVRNRSQSAGQVAPQDQIHDTVVQAIQRKVGQRRAKYRWLDAVGQAVPGGRGGRLRGGRLDADRQRTVVELALDNAGPGTIIVVDYRDMDEGSYAAIVSIFLRESQRLRKRRQGPGIVQLVDEAHRIFDNESRHSASLGGAFERVMREGRSVDHSIIMSLQNASQIPPRVMNNLNTKIVMRQNSKTEAEAATQTMGKDFAVQAMRLGTGHALVSLHESRAVVLAQMAPSPYELMRPDVEDRLPRPGPADDDDMPD